MSSVIESFLGLFKLLLTFVLFYQFGWIKGFALTYIIFFVHKLALKKLFGLSYLGLDKSIMGYKNKERFNILIPMILEDFNVERLKQMIIERGIKKIERLRSIVIYKFYDYFWKEIADPEKLSKMMEKVFRIVELEKEEDFSEFTQRELKSYKEFFHIGNVCPEKGFPYEFILVKFANSTRGGLIFKVDHVVSDGLGISSMACALADNYSEKIFPPIMSMKKYTFLNYIIDLIQIPYYSLYLFCKFYFNTPEKTTLNRYHNDNLIGKSNFANSQLFPLKSVEKIRKTLKISFNDIVVSLTCYTINQFLNKDDSEQIVKSVNFVVPVGISGGIPNKLEEVELFNKASLLFLKLPLINDFESGSIKISKILISNLRCRALHRIPILFSALALEYFPSAIINMFSNDSSKMIDLALSNVPGATTELYLAGSKMLDIYPLMTTGRIKMFIPVASYNKQFRFSTIFDESVSIDPKDFVRAMENNLNELIKKYE